jgi:hypothetical protein
MAKLSRGSDSAVEDGDELDIRLGVEITVALNYCRLERKQMGVLAYSPTPS